MSESLEALRRANPRNRDGFARSVEAAGDFVRTHIATSGTLVQDVNAASPRRRVVRVSLAGAALACTAAVAAFLTIASSGRGPGVESAAAAVQRAVTLTAASAEESGTAVVRITRDGQVWAGVTIRWHGEDLSLSRGEHQRRGRVGSEFRLVDGAMYAMAHGEWVNIGSPESIDPDSGTTPAEYLGAMREDVGGATLRRMTEGMTRLTASELDEGAMVYTGSVAAGLIARESGFKGGRPIRVFPFGYVAHGAAANPDSLLDAVVTVGADGIVREIRVSWGTWTYSVGYRGLGATPAPVAPENARDLLRERMAAD